jgi:hypothetical protein
MTEQEYAALREILYEETPVTIGVVPGPDRTLLYGYDVERFTWHVFQMNGFLHRVVYRMEEPLLANSSGLRLRVDMLVPNKRLYPEGCDFAFCKKLRKLNAYLPFTTFGSMMPKSGPFMGRTY